MAKNERLDESVSKWLEESAPARLPERVLNATFERTRPSRQHVGWRAVVRRLSMPRFLPALGSAAVIVVVAALALSFYVNRQTGVGALPSPTPSASPTVAASPSVEPTATPSPSPLGSEPPSQCADFWDAGGTYQANAGSLALTATVPAGWHGFRDSFYLANSPCGFGGSVMLQAALVSHVYSDICEWQGTAVETGTPAAVTAALAAQAGHDTSGPTDVTLAGYPASRFEFSLPADVDASTCEGTLPLWRAPGARSPSLLGDGMRMEPGNPMTVYVVDVDGSAVGIAASYWEGDATPAEIAELDAVVASLRLTP